MMQFQAGQLDPAIEEDNQTSADNARQGSDFREIAAKRLKTTSLANLLNTNFVMFENRSVNYVLDDFGLSNDDLTFKDIQATDSRW